MTRMKGIILVGGIGKIKELLGNDSICLKESAVVFDKDKNAISIEEKLTKAKSNFKEDGEK